jgi:hypothetical protein
MALLNAAFAPIPAVAGSGGGFLAGGWSSFQALTLEHSSTTTFF